MQSLTAALEMSGKTDTGRVRDHNEDAILFEPDLGLVVLADGMGGYNAGEVASGIATQVVAEMMRAQMAATPAHVKTAGSLWPVAHEMLMLAIDRANSLIYQTSQEHAQCAGMGTTLVSALFYNNCLAIAHVGDSRAYRLRDTKLEQLTKDHSFLQEQIDAGLVSVEEARFAPYKNLVTRAVGINPAVHTELHEYAVEPGDVYLFCSDGLSDMLEDAAIEQLISIYADNLSQATDTLIEQANAEGGRDNVSVVLVKINQAFAVESGIWNKFTGWLGSNGKSG
ncbi:Stp1/IreP family PP2C-type Ser/Thr phosphatase [Chitinibacter tainanensis]|uniref:Stp1/IreP family PP2C-type Ser/Thr phosphatase n=1 Tax=Chitinibacter tainanensis TaxID=230667 RepID=UPI002353AB7E|nr:Stp1/IreP family PP2C-type Ser/Thr phosphatase [Chitinibacter tainanensis]